MTGPAQLLPALGEISFGGRYPAQPTAFHHRLHLDPRMDLEALAQLAERLPHSVVYDTAAQALLVPEGGPPKGTLAQPGDVIRNLDHNNSWLTLLNVEEDPSYADLMNTWLDRVALGMGTKGTPGGRGGAMRQRAAFILTSSPNSVTPVHFDIEHSLLVQTGGSKRVCIGRFESPAALRHEVERYFDGSHGRMRSIPEEVMHVDLRPGTGVAIPPLVPHWVHNDPAISVSITLTYFTAATQRNSRIEDLNSRLRRFHLFPRPPGTSPVTDALKTAAIGAIRTGTRVRSEITRVRSRTGGRTAS